MFRPFPASITPDGIACPLCQEDPEYWLFMAVRLEATHLEFDVYRPSCGCSTFVESPRLISFFEGDDYRIPPFTTAEVAYNVKQTNRGIIVSPKNTHEGCDGDCDNCILSD